MKITNCFVTLVSSLFLFGCAPSEGEKLYNIAFQEEQQSPYSSIGSYRQVIVADSKSPWAQKAQQRIDALLQRRASEEAAHEARRARRNADDAASEARYRSLLSK
jgi:hypothetical protein